MTDSPRPRRAALQVPLRRRALKAPSQIQAVAEVRPEQVSGGEVLQLYIQASGGVDPREQPAAGTQ